MRCIRHWLNMLLGRIDLQYVSQDNSSLYIHTVSLMNCFKMINLYAVYLII